MDVRRYDPELQLPFLELIARLVLSYREFTSANDITEQLGGRRVTDIADAPEMRVLDSVTPLPEGFTQGVFQFWESRGRRGVFDFAFHGERLVNFRAQLLFVGLLGKLRAVLFYVSRLRPFMHRAFRGPGWCYDPLMDGFCADTDDGLKVTFRRPAGEPYVSVCLTDQGYV